MRRCLVARGIYSALGHWPEAALPAMLARFDELARRINAGEPVVGDEALVAAIRDFEMRVGCVCGLQAERVTTPHGPAIELGNIDHRGFGTEHEDAARVVAELLCELLVRHGATGAFAFTLD